MVSFVTCIYFFLLDQEKVTKRNQGFQIFQGICRLGQQFALQLALPCSAQTVMLSIACNIRPSECAVQFSYPLT